MSQIGEFSQGNGQSYGLHEVSATYQIRYRTNRSLVVALGIFVILTISLATFLVIDKVQEMRADSTAKVSVSTESAVETMSTIGVSNRGTMLQTQYGKMFLLSNGELYYMPNSGVKFAADAQPGEAGRFIIEKGDIDGFDFPTSVVDGKAVTTSYVFDGYRILPDKKINYVRELKMDNVVGSRSFLITSEDKKDQILTVTLGSVQRSLVYDEVEQIIYPETTEVEDEKLPIGQDSEEAREAANEELAEAQAKASEPIKVVKRIPRIETSMGEARAQVIEL